MLKFDCNNIYDAAEKYLFTNLNLKQD
jgi:hypothetical protein